MRHPILISVIWLVAIAFSTWVWFYQRTALEAIEEMLWFSLALSLLIQYYPNRIPPLFKLGWFFYCVGMSIDIVDDFVADTLPILNVIDTSVKNLGFVLIGVAMLNMLKHKRGLIKQLNAEIAEREALQKQLLHEAYHDPLTLLGNRRACFEYFETMLDKYESLYYFDLDNFKTANDKHGHLVGDNILKLFSKALIREFGEQNCFRLGGDEFVAFGEDVTLDEKFRVALLSDVKEFNVGVSIGVTKLNRNQSADTLLNLADQQMYNDKSHKIFRSSRRQ